MCGIAGISVRSGAVDRSLLERMAERILHRGPDDVGIEVRGLHGLVHRRLAIIDLSPGGHQPMSVDDGALWTVYNGETYNFQELRDELAGFGHSFRTQSDTEVILRGYRQWGRDVWSRMNGMWALALLDERSGELVLSRDRYGLKPLYYAVLPDRIVYGSEIKAVVADPAVPRELDYEALDFYLSFGYIPDPWTVYKHVRLLPAGCDAVWRDGYFAVNRWYDLAEHREDVPADFDTAKRELRDRLSAAVRRRMIADVPLGAFLSGGVDSSSIVALMSEASDRPVKTFSIGFTDEMWDESAYARIVAERFGTDHHEFRLSERDILDVVPTVLDHLDQPFSDSSALPTFLVSKYTRDEVTVALAGDAADETFAGYRKYQGEYAYSLYRRVPGFLRKGLIEPIIRMLPETQTSRMGEMVRRVRRFLAASGNDTLDRHFEWMDLSPGEVRDILTGTTTGPLRARALVRQLDEQSGESDLNAVLFGDIRLSLPNDMFAKVDMMSMYHALEVREPFTDPTVIEYAAGMPADWKLHKHRRKHVLLEAMRGTLPPEIMKRGKQGFILPLSRWLHTEFETLFHDIVTEDAVRELGLVDMEGVRRLYSEHRSYTADHTYRLWLVLVVHWWHQRVHTAL